jgi:non-specific serine/threonine protein kinase
LLDHSLLQADDGETEERRFRMLETIREYGQEELATCGELEATGRAHVDFYLTLAEQAEAALLGPENERWLRHLDAEHANLRAALTWLRGRGERDLGLRLGGAIWVFWWHRAHYAEGLAQLESLLALTGLEESAAEAKALLGAGALAWVQGDVARALPRLEAALTRWRAAGDRRGIAQTLFHLGMTLLGTDLPRAGEAFAEGLTLSRAIGDPWGIGSALYGLGRVRHAQGDIAQATLYLEEALAIARSMDFEQGTVSVLQILGEVAYDQGELAQAANWYAEALAIVEELDYQWNIAGCLDALARVAAAWKQPVVSARLFGAVAALQESIGTALLPSERSRSEQTLGDLRAALGEETFAAAWSAGHALPLPDAIAEAKALSRQPTRRLKVVGQR